MNDKEFGKALDRWITREPPEPKEYFCTECGDYYDTEDEMLECKHTGQR
jgi:hypothetical protein